VLVYCLFDLKLYFYLFGTLKNNLIEKVFFFYFFISINIKSGIILEWKKIGMILVRLRSFNRLNVLSIKYF
jgi:hypothetical protein